MILEPKYLRRGHAALALGLALGLALPPATRPVAPAVIQGGPAATVIAAYQARIPAVMAEQGIPGLAVALVDGDQAIWVEGFGYTDRDARIPVTTDTIFSVQSMSKTFTATAVMAAVAEGMVDLDEPITTYVPEFTVKSAFEAHPERRITLRMLLAHTAGFTHEAPVGNNLELEPGAFDDHVRSISDTWLRFPVGTGYAYSNLGIDLAGYVLERVYGKPFAALMRDVVLAPLGMVRSTFDREQIRSTPDRAVGHIQLLPEVPVDVPMSAAGGLYSSASDLARFLRFQLNGGSIDGRVVLDQALVEEMRTLPEPYAGDSAGYALGVARTRWRAGGNADLFNHGGGGFGFLSDLWWLPQLQLGIAILTNSSDHRVQGDLALSILRDLVVDPGSAYHERMLALPSQAGPIEPNGNYQAPKDMASYLDAAAMPPSDDDASRWAGYSGPYRMFTFGALDPTAPPDRFLVLSGRPYFETNETGTVIRHPLTEVEAGLFLADNGETLDLRGAIPTWRSIDLVRAAGGPTPWQWGMLAAVALVAILWLIAWFVRTVRRRRAGVQTGDAPRPRAWRRVAAAVATLVASLTLLTIALVIAVPGLVDSGFIGWIVFPLALRLALHLPLVLALVTVCLCGFAAYGIARHWWPRAVGFQYSALSVATLALVGQLGAGGLIGCGF
jgi:CubicO group peptidase (beta-lactamase class C family)